MQGKKRTGVVTERSVQAVLRRGPVPELAPNEEKAMRMRFGAALPLSARLERIASATDAEIELLAFEIEAYLHLKKRRAAARVPVRAAAPKASRVKEKIVRVLRKKS
jgi:hypothetical protein